MTNNELANLRARLQSDEIIPVEEAWAMVKRVRQLESLANHVKRFVADNKSSDECDRLGGMFLN